MEQEILKFLGKLEQEVQDLDYGTITVNIILVNGQPTLKTLNMVKSRRVRYPMNKGGDDNGE